MDSNDWGKKFSSILKLSVMFAMVSVVSCAAKIKHDIWLFAATSSSRHYKSVGVAVVV
jgi:hypothetical protein